LVPRQALAAQLISLIEAHDAGSEARAVARVVLEAIERGTPLDRIAIVPVDLAEAFLEPLRFELLRASIPFAEPRGRPAIAAPRAHAALELLRLARGPLGRDALVDVLRVPGLSLERWFSAGRAGLGELLHELDSLPLRVERVPGELLAELGDRLAQLASDDPAQAARLSPLRDGLGAWLQELSGLGQVARRSEHAARAQALFNELSLFEPSARTLRFALSRAARGARELLTGLGHDSVAASSVQTAFERSCSAAAALGVDSEQVPLASWLEEVELSLEGVAPARGAARAAAVRIARPDDVAGMALALVVLCRASDMSLDRAAPSESALGAELETALPLTARPPSTGLEQHFSALSVASALSRAERVVVTWALHDESTTLSPSRLARSLSRRASPRREPASPLSPSAHRTTPVSPRSPSAFERVSVERAHAAFYASPSSPLDGLNGEAGSLAAFFGGEPARPLAVTALERAIRCPFLAFSGGVLRATRDDPMGDAIGYRERGSLLHEALAAALEATRGAWGTSSALDLIERGAEAARALLEQRGRSSLRRAGLAGTLADVRAMLLFVFSHQDGLVFRYAERAFGDQAEWGPLELGPWLVSGRVDRIDASADGQRVRVIDYKTRAPKKADDLALLQPWLYARKVGLEFGAEQVEFCFLSFDKRNPTLRTVYDGAVEGEAISAALERAESTLASLRAGRVPARPASGSSCARCDARDICRRPLSAPESSEE
jgi:RecB family exonuclease